MATKPGPIQQKRIIRDGTKRSNLGAEGPKKSIKPVGVLKKVEPKRAATTIYQNGFKYTRVSPGTTVKSSTYGAMTVSPGGQNSTAGARATAAASRKTAASLKTATQKRKIKDKRYIPMGQVKKK